MGWSFFKKLRVQLWWNHIVPPIIASIYFVVWHSGTYTSDLGIKLLLFVISLFCYAGFGYFLNDVSDIEADKLAGKPNSASELSKTSRIVIGGGLFFTGMIPWFWLPNRISTTGLLLLLFLCLVVYSVRPFRFKERGFPGLICDIHYGHVLPVFIAVNTFGILYEVHWPSGFFYGVLLYLLLFAKGLRNILCHQVEDSHGDNKSGIKTVTTSFGIPKISRLIGFVLSVEFVLLIILVITLSTILLLPFTIFILVNIILVISWGTIKLPYKEIFAKLWFILNDFYEEWLPLFLVILVVVKYPLTWWLLLIHLLLFNRGVLNMVIDFKNIFKWLYLIIRKYYFTHLQKKLLRH